MTAEDKKSRQREYSRRWRERHPEKAKENTRRWAEANPDKVRAKSLRRLYGMTVEQYDKRVTELDNRCAACGGPPTQYGILVVDHDHATNKFRDLLCHGCNTSLGYAGDSPERLEQLAVYLRKHKE